MTEAEWLACDDPAPMLGFLRGRAGERKLRLFACACCRRVRDRFWGAKLDRALARAEAYADGEASEAELEEAFREVAGQTFPFSDAVHVAQAVAWAASTPYPPGDPRAVAKASLHAALARAAAGGLRVVPPAERRQQAALLRDLFGTLPFRPVAFDPAWRTPNVLDLARTIYEERCFDRLPILADALLDAGCYSPPLLSHCHSMTEHARGCWALDLILGKE